ncbi:uncharacterized protein [Argopecten irradians]|uniref:uncharacterized protein isoform X2 n=1 Tax=Argopecten irradians TaxID=31199 RepID=UPI00371553F9
MYPTYDWVPAHLGARQQVYDPNEHICCYGGTFPKVDHLGQEQSCCASKPYVPSMGNLCCVPQPHGNHATARLYTYLVGENARCCGNRIYSKNTSVCCTDDSYQVRLYPKDSRKICCQEEYISTDTEECAWDGATGRMTSRSKFTRPCGNSKIDNREELCCNGHRHRVEGQISDFSCCGNELINLNTQRCCNNIHIMPANMECCGSETNGYNPRTQRCCNGVPKVISQDSDQCCGDIVIDTNTQNCCNGQAYNILQYKICRDNNNHCSAASITEECCGSEALNHDNVCCKAGTSFNYSNFQKPKTSSSHNRCCTSYAKGNTHAIPYSDQTEECHRGHTPTVTQILNKPRCGKLYYDKNTDVCCFNRLYSNATLNRQSCCGHKVFNLATQSCCHWKVYNSTSCPEKFCGRRIYDPSVKICCGGKVHRKIPGKKCCGKNTYDPREGACCGSKKCRKPEHPICEWLCEQDEKKIRHKIRTEKIDICKTNVYVARVGKKNSIGGDTRLELKGRKTRLFNENQTPFKVKKLFHHTCVCDKKPRKESRRKILVITDKSIRDRRVNLSDEDYILPFTNKIKKTLTRYWGERCNTPTSLVTAEVVDEIFDFIKKKIEKQQHSKFYDN